MSDEDQTSKRSSSHWLRELLDWTVKFIPAIATIAVALIAHRFQSSMTATTLLSEREKADSQLRATMFSDLIGPIVGPDRSGAVDVDRERILAELLALNFHEHFELKPLLLHVDRRLAAEITARSGNATQDARESLRSTARRVIARQTALLSKKEAGEPPDQQTQIMRIDLVNPPAGAEKIRSLPIEQGANDLVRRFNEPIEIHSPSKTYKLYLVFDSFDAFNQTVRVDVSIFANGSAEGSETAHNEFQLSWFDFPFTDNTLLADGTRFALVIDQVDDLVARLSEEEKRGLSVTALPRLRVDLIWFPRDYFAARERPTNYRQFREKLGLELK